MNATHAAGTHIKKSGGRIAFEIFNSLFLTALSFIFLLPVLHVLFSSMSDPDWLNAQSGVVMWPHGFNLEGYKKVFQNQQLIRGFLNTIFYVSSATLLGMVITIISGFVLSRQDLLWKNVIMFLISFTMLFSGGIIPLYIIIQKLGLLDSRMSIILPSCLSTFNLIMMRTAFSSVPKEMEESAKLDGANDLVIIFRIMLPLVKATVATITMYYVIAHWNSWFSAAMYLRDRDKYPLQIVLREILIMNDTTSTAADASAAAVTASADSYKQLVKYCTIIVSSLPMILVYPFVMKYFRTGVMVGAVKG